MRQVFYVSSATELMSEEALGALLDRSRGRNASVGITGLLLYLDGNFFQVIEGPDEAIEALYLSISRDCRHRHMRKIVDRAIDRRDFPSWSMGFRRLRADDGPGPDFLNLARGGAALDAALAGGGLVTDLMRRLYDENV